MHYKTVSFDEAPEELLEEYGVDALYDYGDFLVRVDDDGTETVIYADGGEPEDMILRRNLGVFVGELNRAAGYVASQ
jgi:hypothetical protein